ncbi:unnamed protein product, partial [Ectocarpus fasciculatus]
VVHQERVRVTQWQRLRGKGSPPGPAAGHDAAAAARAAATKEGVQAAVASGDGRSQRASGDTPRRRVPILPAPGQESNRVPRLVHRERGPQHSLLRVRRPPPSAGGGEGGGRGGR